MKKLRKRLLKYFVRFVQFFVLFSIVIVLPLRWLNPPITMVMGDRWLSSVNESFTLRQEWLDWPAIPKQAALAVVTSEDQRFPTHIGFDFNAIYNVIKSMGRGTQLRGASTISQQVARNVYLWTGRSWLRKGLEVWFTMLIELFWGKQRILEVYLNVAEWGDGVFGLEAASYYYFNKPARQLSPMQMALLASTLPSPIKYDPAHPAQHLVERAQWNLEQQKKLGSVRWLNQID